jgi:hypothetical protein
MSNDTLARAASALRDSYDGASADAEATRARVLARAALRRKRRRSAMLVLLPLAAAFVMSSAWAAVTGRVPDLAALLRRALPAATRPVVGGSPAPSRDSMPDAVALVVSTPLVAPLAPAASTPVVPVASAPSPPASASRITPATSIETAPRDSLAPAGASPLSARRAAPSPEPSRPSVDAATDVEESLYADAHKAHFVARDPAAALRGWDAYLRTYPDGHFALEARYNRALTLVRLGQLAEARAALAPFADGSTGGYRQHEARALLDALDGGP